MPVKKPKIAAVEEEDLTQIDGLSDFVSDPLKEQEGTWREMNDGSGRAFLVAHAENSEFQAKLVRLMRPQQPILRKQDERSIMLLRKLQGIAMAGTVLRDWRNINDSSGEEIVFSTRLAEKILVDDRFRKLRTQIEQWAEIEDAYVEEAEEEAAKN